MILCLRRTAAGPRLFLPEENDAASAVFALKSLQIGPIYTIGFKSRGPLCSSVTPLTAIEDLKHFEHPFVIISALPADKSLLVGPLLKHYGSSGHQPGVTSGKVFLDLADGVKKGDRGHCTLAGLDGIRSRGRERMDDCGDAPALGRTECAIRFRTSRQRANLILVLRRGVLIKFQGVGRTDEPREA